MDTVISWIMLLFLFLGAADYALGNRLGIGDKFIDGLMASGRLMICMAGFMVLAPVLARGLGPVVAPFFRAIGADPSAIAGILLANDAGGTALALELADTRDAGLFNGLIVGAGMGTTVMFIIPMTMANTAGKERSSAIFGLLAGIITVPLGCLAGGFAAGFPASIVLGNTLPVLAISVLLVLSLLFFGKGVIPVFTVIGRFLELVSVFGLCCGAAEHLTGHALIPGTDTFDTVFPIVGGITIFLAGAFPLLAVIQKLFAALLNRAAQLLGTSQTGVAGLVMALANGIPTVSMLHDMDDRGRMFATAFLVSGSCIFGDHMAYTAQVAPQYCGAVVVGKAVGCTTALLLAILLAPRMLAGGVPGNQRDGGAMNAQL